jgi:hypothetical protein
LRFFAGADDLPNILHGKDLGKLTGRSSDVVGDGYLFFGHMFVEKTKTAKNAVAAVGSDALIQFEIKEIVLDLFLSHLVWR